ncbi:MAG: FtsQ-type POTRA domain-containing protein, partial [Bacteriovorax sp.]|nr:FtsQ-type POTRA domain-containing protein [Bacteriovorax sp.]
MHTFFLLVLLVLSSPARSEILREIEIVGNTRTSNEAIIKHGQIKINQNVDTEALEKIQENLGRIGQIILKKVEFNSGILKITMEDKWTIFPVPMITQSGNYHNRGFLIYEDNFLGTLGTFAPGISWSNSILNYLLYFQDETFFTSDYGIKFLFLKKSDLVEFSRQRDIIDTHESRYNSYLLAPNYLFNNQVFKAGPIFIEKSIYKNGVKNLSENSKGLFFRHHWNAYKNLDFMYQGIITTYDFYALNNKNNDSTYLHEATLISSLPINVNFLNLGLHCYYSNNRSYLFSKNLGGD